MLLPGDPAPDFTCASSVNPAFHFDTVAGRYVALCFFASAELPFAAKVLEEVRRRHARFDVADAVFCGVSVDPQDRGRLAQEAPGVIYFWDADLAVSRLYGAVEPEAGSDAEAANTVEGADPADADPVCIGGGTADVPVTVPEAGGGASAGAPTTRYAYRPRTVVLDQAMRVVAVVPFGDDPAGHVAEVVNVIDGLPRVESLTTPAPALVVPYVFEPDLCRALVAYYEAHGGTDSGFMRDVDGRTVAVLDHGRKRRSDCEVHDDALVRATQQRLGRRVIPAIRQAFQFGATRIERHIVACYDAADGGHFRAHRDNTTLGTAHRRFAVTINLNADAYDGGDLWFPEFGRRRYRAATGGAVVFSCSLMHEATPVTRGRRYAFLPFLYDDAAARVRDANRRYLAGGPPIRGSENARSRA